MKIKLPIFLLVVLTFGLFNQSNLEAGVLQQVVRKAGKVADNIPLRPMEETMTSPATREMAQDLMKKTRKVNIPYSHTLIQEIKATSGAFSDPKVLRALETLDDAGLEVVMLASRGAKNVTSAVPDVMRRAELLRQVDMDTLCVLGRFEDLAGQAHTFQRALANPANIPSPAGMRRVTLDDFGAFFKKFGQKGHDFWMDIVKPNWKWWAGGTALAAILLTPEEDLDKAVKSVGWAAKKVIHTGSTIADEGVEVLTDATGKTLETVGNAAGKTIMSVLKGFFSTWFGACFAVIGGILLLLYTLSNSIVQSFLKKIGKMFVSIRNFVCRKQS